MMVMTNHYEYGHGRSDGKDTDDDDDDRLEDAVVQTRCSSRMLQKGKRDLIAEQLWEHCRIFID